MEDVGALTDVFTALMDVVETVYTHEERAEDRWGSVKRFLEQRRMSSPLSDTYEKWMAERTTCANS